MNASSKRWILKIPITTEKVSWLEKHEPRKKSHYLKYVHFEKKGSKVRKHIIFTCYHYRPYSDNRNQLSWNGGYTHFGK